MVISKETIEKIKKIIEKNYNHLVLSITGKSTLSKEELKQLKDAGFDVSNEDSLLALVYYNYVLNDLKSPSAPKNISEMKKQQQAKPTGDIHSSMEENLNQSLKHYADKLSADAQSSIEGIIRNYNMQFRSKLLADPAKAEDVQQLIKESTVGQIKQKLRDAFKDMNRNWERVAVTETANALGLGSVDRVAMMNRDKKPEDIFVFRIPVNDIKLCASCRKFYLDRDQTPAVYRLSTLLGNGTNYGKKVAEWKPVAVATHPNDRESGVIQLRPGWRVGPEGKLEYIGLKDWDAYIKNKLRG